MILSRDQITITDLHDGIDGNTYVLNIIGGTRSVTYNTSGASPSPAQTAFSFELLKNGAPVSPSSIAWSATGHLSGTSSGSTFTPAISTSYSTGKSDSVSLTVVYSGITIRETVAISITKLNAGINAKIITLNPSGLVFKQDKLGAVTPTSITLTSQAQNTSVSTWSYSVNGAAFSTTKPTWLTTPSAGVLTVTSASMKSNNITSLAVKVADSSGVYFDTVTLIRAIDGSDGSNGSDGSDGAAPITGYLTNESITLSATNEGVTSGLPISGISEFKILDGITEVSPTSIGYSLVQGSLVGCTASINSSGLISLSALTSDNGSAQFAATYGGQTIKKTISFAKSKQGVVGPQGSTGPGGLSSILLNENQPITVTTGRLVSPAQTVTIPFTAFSGSSRVACTATVGSLPTGVSVTSNTAGTTSANGSIVLAFALNANLGGVTTAFDTGSITITVTASGVAIPLVFSYAKVVPGTNGTARMYFVEPAVDSVVRLSNGTYASSTISVISYYRDNTSQTRTARTAYWKAEYLVGATWTSFATHTASLISTYAPSIASVPATARALRFTAYSNVGLTTIYDLQTVAIVSDGRSITSVDVWYYLSTSDTVLAGDTWDTNAPPWENNKYMWSKTVTTYSTGDPTESTPVCITGAKGSNGTTGRGVSSIVEEFYLSTSKTTQTGSSWKTTPDPWSPGKYMWTRSKITYTSGTPTTSTTTPLVSSEWEAVNEIPAEIEKSKEEIYLRNIVGLLESATIEKDNIDEKTDFLLSSPLDTNFLDDLTEQVGLYNASFNTFKNEVDTKILANTVTEAEFENIQVLYSTNNTQTKLILNLIEQGYRLFQTKQTEETLDSLKLGSRNLLINSDFSKGLNYWTVEAGQFTQTTISNDTYLTASYVPVGDIKPTISQELLKSSESYSIGIDAMDIDSVLRIEIESRNGSTVVLASQDFSLSNSLNRFFFKARDLNPDLKHFITIKVIAGTAIFTKPKVETGIIPTDWSPAPEDYQILIDEILDDNILTRSERASLYKEFQQILSEYNTLLNAFNGNEVFSNQIDALIIAYNSLYETLDPILGLAVDAEGTPTNPLYSNEDILEISNASINSVISTYYQKLNDFKTSVFKESYTKSTDSWGSLADKIDNTRAAIMQRLINDQSDPTSNFIYEEDGQIYINAAFIKLGQLDAKYVRTGILSSEPNEAGLPVSWIDLNTGSFSFGGGALSYSPTDGLKIVFGQLLDSYLEAKAEDSKVNTVSDTAEDAKALAESIQKSLSENISFEEGKIIIGTVGPDMMRFELSNTNAIFYYGSTALAEFTNDSLKSPRIIVEENITVGTVSGSSFKMELKASNGNLTFRRA